MTSRERVTRFFGGNRRTAWPSWTTRGTTPLRWVKEGYPVERVHRKPGESYRLPDNTAAKVTEEGDYPEPAAPWKHFRYDMAGVGGWFDAMPKRGVDELLEETGEWEVRRNGAGGALKYWKNKSGTPEHIDFLMTSRKVWDREYRPCSSTWTRFAWTWRAPSGS